ncbi:MAG TPA: TerC/Alx family metal homeostasis membrane protein [Opitutaceae bacterium]|nr:TerC/Alx family metal homeostasis membrane protein [Opitutaceae bacterium]
MNPVTSLWIVFWVLFLVVSAIDYALASRREGGMSVKSALRWTVVWVFVALTFSGAIYVFHPRGKAIFLEFLSGYLTEYSLSIDNLFVFILIFSLMGVAENAQPKLIKLGIYLSIVLRIVFILFGIALINRFHWLLYVFGAALCWTAWKMMASGDHEDVDPKHNLLYRLASKLLPIHQENPPSRHLFTRSNGRFAVTPLFLVFLVIGSTDVLFAIDSIPAIMGISQDSFVVMTSNVFAVLGLNSLFFAIRGVMGLFKFLKHGVSLILFFIGAKMIAGIYHPIEDWFKDRPFVSLIVILAVLITSVVVSILHDRLAKKPAEATEV